jgi:hypothetical protein
MQQSLASRVADISPLVDQVMRFLRPIRAAAEKLRRFRRHVCQGSQYSLPGDEAAVAFSRTGDVRAFSGRNLCGASVASGVFGRSSRGSGCDCSPTSLRLVGTDSLLLSVQSLLSCIWMPPPLVDSSIIRLYRIIVCGFLLPSLRWWRHDVLVRAFCDAARMSRQVAETARARRHLPRGARTRLGRCAYRTSTGQRALCYPVAAPKFDIVIGLALPSPAPRYPVYLTPVLSTSVSAFDRSRPYETFEATVQSPGSLTN